jgi:hypothetical protein
MQVWDDRSSAQPHEITGGGRFRNHIEDWNFSRVVLALDRM